MGDMTRAGTEPVLSVRGLKLHYFTSKGAVRAVDGISFDLYPGETLGLVGESGCGKTSAGSALLGMASPPGRIVEGSILVDGTEVVGMSERSLRRDLRWSKVSMVFQGAMNCLTPVYTIRELMAETYREHAPEKKRDAVAKGGEGIDNLLAESLRLVGLPAATLGRYPHELSGGMKQRVAIAMALFLEPKVVVMDEPTTALDVIVQAQILNLVKGLKRDLGLSCVFITHDLATEAEIADRILVMYAGRMAELGSSEDIFGNDPRRGSQRPRRGSSHPYTKMLLASTPRLHRRVSELAFIPGSPPDLIDPPEGCRFAPRCPFAKAKCHRDEPPISELGPGHLAACWKAMEDPEYERL
jgi:peptide/nickel transport system ATP-binding protein